jgi:hypothetical protein
MGKSAVCEIFKNLPFISRTWLMFKGGNTFVCITYLILSSLLKTELFLFILLKLMNENSKMRSWHEVKNLLSICDVYRNHHRRPRCWCR